MGKAIVNMKNWELYVYDEHYNLSGTADKHPTIGINAYVSRTSSLVDFTYKDEELIYETRNTIYVCPLKYMTTRPYGNVILEYKLELTHRDEARDSVLDKIIATSAKLSIEYDRDHDETGWLAKHNGFNYKWLDYSDDTFLQRIKQLQVEGQREIKEADDIENARLISIANQYEDCVYIEVSNIECGDKLAYHLGDYSGTVEPRLHSGMFQDSVLYMKYGEEGAEENSLDFRYFPKGWGDTMETYSWSDNIKQAIIKNLCGETIQFNGENVEPNEVKIFTPDNYSQGLISPDCYNGKSVFSNKKVEDD